MKTKHLKSRDSPLRWIAVLHIVSGERVCETRILLTQVCNDGMKELNDD